MSKQYTKRDFDTYCKKHGIKPVSVFSYKDSAGHENLMVLDDRLMWMDRINRISRFVADSEKSAEESKKLTTKTKS